MALILITDKNGNEGWQARLTGRSRGGRTAYFAVSKWGKRKAKTLASGALERMRAGKRIDRSAL